MSSTPFHTSAYDAVYAAVVARLTREGVTVGKTAFLPRIEVHTVTEGQRQEKGGDVRTVDLTVESVSNRFLGEASQMNTENLRLLTETPLALEGWHLVGVLPDQLQDLTEASDSDKIVYRLLQQVSIIVQRYDDDEEAETDIPIEPDPDIPEEPAGPPVEEQDPATEEND